MKAVIIAVIVAATLCAAMKPESFSFSRPLIAPGSSSGEVAAFRFDRVLYSGMNRSFSDLRLFDAQSREVPFYIRTITADTTVAVDYQVGLEQVSFKQLTSNRMEMVFKRDCGVPIPTGLQVATPVFDFESTVSVYGSTDKTVWYPLIENSPIYDYSQFVSMRNTTVPFNRGVYTYYKVTIDKVVNTKRSLFSRIVTETTNGTEQKRYNDFITLQEMLRIDTITFNETRFEVQYGKSRSIHYTQPIIQINEDTAHKSTEKLLASYCVPIRELTIKTASINFSRHVQIEATNDSLKKALWNIICTGDVCNVSIGTYRKQNLTVSLGSTQRFLRYRLTIFNNDNSSIKIDSISALGEQHEGLFFHRGMKIVKLCYGNDTAKSPHYDINTILINAPVLQGEVWQPGTSVGNTKLLVPRFSAKYLFIGSLILMVLVLGGALAVTVRKVDKNTKNGDGEGGG